MSYLGQVELKSSDIRRVDVTSSTSATHTLTWTPPSEQSLIVTINGVKQQNNYTISGTTLTLDSALVATDELEVVGILDIGTTNIPADDSITNAMVKSDAAIAQSKLATLAIDTAELADDAVTADKLANSINTEITANTAKVTNATHTGDVTGATALTIATDAVDIAMLSATGTASSSTFLRGDNSWAAAGGDNTPAFQAWRITSSQSIAHNTNTKLEFQSEVYDTDSAYDNSTNFRFTVPVGEAGKYMFYCGVHADCETNGAFKTAIVRAKVNGSYMIIFNDTNYDSGYIRKASFAGSAVLDLSEADYVELYFQGSKNSSTGTNFTITANATYYQSFWGCYKMIGI